MSSEQPCLKTTGLCDLLSGLFHFFSISYLELSFHLVCFPISPPFLLYFLRPLSSVVEKLLYT